MTKNDTPFLQSSAIFLVLALALAGLGPVAGAAEQATAVAPSQLFSRDLKIDHRYLNIPIKRGAPKQKVALLVDGIPIVVNDMELAEADPDWWAFIDLKAWQGRTATACKHRSRSSGCSNGEDSAGILPTGLWRLRGDCLE